MNSTYIAIAVVVAVVVVVIAVFVAKWRSRSGTSEPRTQERRTETELKSRLSRTRTALSRSLGGVFASDALPDKTWQEIEDALVAADVGPGTSADIVERVRSSKPKNGGEAREALVSELISSLSATGRELRLEGSPAVIVVVGVNGSGKTTTIAKIAHGLVSDGRTVVFGAADTFRAGAAAQLRQWGDRVGARVVSGVEGADPASVAYEAFATASTMGADVVIVDTAGRLHNQRNLMDELGKVVRVLEREASVIGEMFLVLDGTTGQNGIAQARAFTEAVGVTGVVLTKLDGTSRGGIAIAVEQELGIPVKFIGVGEGLDDLVPFVPEDFVEALLAP